MLEKMNILLVDDDESIRTSMKYFFKNKTQSILTLESAEEALAYLRAETHPDIIVSDYRLPGMNGLDFLKAIKSERPEVMTALITAHGRMELAIEAIRLGVQDFVQKPFTGQTIYEALQALAQRAGDTTGEPHVDGKKISETGDARWRKNADFIISKVCHQINNTIQSLQASAETGLLSLGGNHPMSARLNDMLCNIERVRQINKELRSFGNCVAREPLETVAVNELLQRCLNIFRGNILKEGICVDLCSALTDGITVTTRGGILLHILDNLVVNAIQAIAENDRTEKSIVISTAAEDGKIRIQIADNGVGMDPQVFENARKKGFTTKAEGTGLGLFIVDRLATEIGASLSLVSQPGQGTVASLECPVEWPLPAKNQE